MDDTTLEKTGVVLMGVKKKQDPYGKGTIIIYHLRIRKEISMQFLHQEC